MPLPVGEAYGEAVAFRASSCVAGHCAGLLSSFSRLAMTSVLLVLLVLIGLPIIGTLVGYLVMIRHSIVYSRTRYRTDTRLQAFVGRFTGHNADFDVCRAAHEAICRFWRGWGMSPFAFLPSDKLVYDLRIDPEAIADLVNEVCRATDRDPTPLSSHPTTLGELVMIISDLPKRQQDAYRAEQ